MDATEAIQLADYRQEVVAIYSRVRELGCNEASWSEWPGHRDELFRTHPRSPIPEAGRPDFKGLTYFHYDPHYRIEATVEPLDEPLVQHLGEGKMAVGPSDMPAQKHYPEISGR